MAVFVASKTDAAGSVTPAGLSTETSVYAPAAQTVDAFVEGYVSLQNMVTGDTVVLNEYVAVDGTNFELVNSQTYSGAQAVPAIRLVGKLVGPSANGVGGGVKWKTTVNQTAGTVRAFPYSYTLFLLNT